MKPGIMGFLKNSRTLLAGALLAAFCGVAWPDDGRFVHITTAESMAIDVHAFRPVGSVVAAEAFNGSWTPVNLPHKLAGWPSPAVPSGTAGTVPMTTTWYRMSLAGLRPSNNTMHLYLLRWQAAGELAVYADGRLLHRSIGTPAWNYFRHSHLFIPLKQAADAAPPRELLIRVDSQLGTGGSISSLYAGDTDALYSKYSTREWFEYQLPFMGGAAFLAVGCFALAVWFVRRRELLYFLVFAIAVLSATRRWHFHFGLERLHIPDQWFVWIIFNALVWLIVANHSLLVLLHGRRRKWLSRGLIGIAGAVTVLSLPWFSIMAGLVQLAPQSYLGHVAAAIILIAVNAWDAWRTRSREAWLLVNTTLLTVLFGTYDWLNGLFQFSLEGFYLQPYGNMAMFVAVSSVMFRRYLGAIADVERVNASLEQRLQAREAELAASHQRLREIEQHQLLSQERQRLMQDMHDGLGSSLTSALRAVERGHFDEAGIAQVLKGCIDDLKLAIDSMEPVGADLLLLLATLRFRLEPRLESTGIVLRWEVKDVPPLDWLDPRNALHILRILQEAFTNIIKHTRATEIRVATGVEHDCVVVTIADNGQGFAVESALKGSGKGLSNQQRRAASIGAEIGWDSNDKGSRMTLRLPISLRSK